MESVKPEPLYLLVLRQELQRRKLSNPRYSLRAFAYQMDIDPATMSRIFNNKQVLSLRDARVVVGRLKIASGLKRVFLDSLLAEHAAVLRRRLASDPEIAALLEEHAVGREELAESERLERPPEKLFPIERVAEAQRLARSAAGVLGDWVSLHLRAPDGGPFRIESYHPRPELIRKLLRLEARFPMNPAAPHGIARALRSGQREVLTTIPDAMINDDLQNVRFDPESVRFYLEHRLVSQICVPIRGKQSPLGTLTLSWAETVRRHVPAEVEQAERLARQIGLALRGA